MKRIRNTVSVNVDVDVDLSEIDTEDLKSELISRNVNIDDPKPEFKSSLDVLRYLKHILGLQNYHSTERLIQEINNL
jgi:hypothetical protein